MGNEQCHHKISVTKSEGNPEEAVSPNLDLDLVLDRTLPLNLLHILLEQSHLQRGGQKMQLINTASLLQGIGVGARARREIDLNRGIEVLLTEKTIDTRRKTGRRKNRGQEVLPHLPHRMTMKKN